MSPLLVVKSEPIMKSSEVHERGGQQGPTRDGDLIPVTKWFKWWGFYAKSIYDEYI
jgi:hypothetical protein